MKGAAKRRLEEKVPTMLDNLESPQRPPNMSPHVSEQRTIGLIEQHRRDRRVHAGAQVVIGMFRPPDVKSDVQVSAREGLVDSEAVRSD